MSMLLLLLCIGNVLAGVGVAYATLGTAHPIPRLFGVWNATALLCVPLALALDAGGLPGLAVVSMLIWVAFALASVPVAFHSTKRKRPDSLPPLPHDMDRQVERMRDTEQRLDEYATRHAAPDERPGIHDA